MLRLWSYFVAVVTATALFFIPASVFAAYCTSQGNYQSYEWIEQIDVGSFSYHSSQNGGYGDFTQQTINAAPGESIPVSLHPGFRSSTYTEYWRLWIDLNQDDIFSSDELLYSGSSRYTINTNIVIPVDAGNGNTRLRVSMKYGSYPEACGNFTYGEVEDYTIIIDGEDTLPPTVTTVSPADNATDLPVSTDVNATFSEAMDAATLTSTTFLLHQGATPVAGSVYYNSVTKTSVFTPLSELGYNTTYTATLTTAVTDSAGNALETDYSWQFTTEADPSTILPTILSTAPSDQQVNIPPDTTLIVLFSKAMNPDTINVDTLSLSDGSSAVSGTVSYDTGAFYAEFIPDSPLDYDTSYTATVSGNVEDTYGNPLGTDETWSFTTMPFQLSYCTSGGNNTYYMRMGSVKINDYTFVYSGGAVNGYRDETLVKTFDLNWDYPASITLTPSYPGYAYTVYWKVWIDWNQDGIFAESEAVFNARGNSALSGSIPIADGALPGMTRMRVAMKYGGYAAPCEHFSYGEVADYTVEVPVLIDTIPPTVVNTSPTDGATDISASTSVSAVFSESMDPSTLSDATFYLSDGTNPVAGTVAYDDPSKTATFMPDQNLLFETTYTAVITTGAADGSGNQMADDLIWTFTTQPESQPVYGISGQINNEGSGLANVTVTLDGDASMETTTDASGAYLFSGLTPGSFSITPALTGYGFTPVVASVEVIDQDITGIDFEAQAGGGTVVWGFDGGTLAGFSTYETANGDATFGTYYYDVDGDGQNSWSAYMQVGSATFTGNYEGGGIVRTISLTDGDLNVTIDTKTVGPINTTAGNIEVFFDDELMDSFNIGTLPDAPVYHQLEFYMENAAAGQHEIKIQTTRKYLKTNVFSYFDNITLTGSSIVP